MSKADEPAVAHLRNQVLTTFKDVWKEYYEWEPVACARALSSLSVARHSRPRSLPSELVETAVQETHRNSGNSWEPSPDDLSLTVHTLVDDTWSSTSLDCEAVLEIALPSQHAAYESCTPLSQNILHGDDSNFMPYLPHADQPSFDCEDHSVDYKALAWQEPYRDSDTLEIVLETARRLGADQALSLTQIDNTGVLPRTLRTTSVWGALWTGNHNDPIVWPGSSRLSRAPRDISPPSADNLRARLQDYLTLWCPSPDCTQAHCFSHNVEQFNLATDITVNPFRCLQALRSCGKDCSSEHPTASENDVSWSEQDIDDLRVIANLGTPMTPCDLAGLCRKPCYEVAIVCRKHDDFCVPVKRARGRPRSELVKKQAFRSEKAPEFVPNQPCIHPGPCGLSSACPCFLNKAHCSRNCRCSRNCPRRWQGCRCAATPARPAENPSKRRTCKPCAGKQCPCWAANRECDPEVCLNCDYGCRNMQIQEGLPKLTEVKTGKYGFGLFVTEDVKQGDFILEYLGELIYEPTFFCRAQVTSHIGRSYVFALNNLMSVDAFPAGNGARFINHSPSDEANVAVSILLVHGEHRIGVFAKTDIESGSELFMNYGPVYFIKHAQDEA